ncbi:MAG: nucleotidyl transferase AbiEii/AbiGii toxin family protein [Bacteroidales bacterium]|nr:nucleotidyl transferase AbiEii/AbiGii toxin family protein [Bacteroidales bacterium]
MYKEILSKEQLELLPLIARFRREFCLVGGTAVALHIGHRRSVDFYLFKYNPLNHKDILQKLNASPYTCMVTRRVTEQLNVIIHKVKLTFYQYPYEIPATVKLDGIIKFPDLLTLAAMKAFALGRRSKWKDYVDLYFILKSHYTISQISDKATEIFGALFSEKLFRAQLCYFEDIDYSEKLEYIGNPVPEEEIKAFLTEVALDI